MKKLAIFGDSFADDSANKHHKSWIDFLKNQFDVTNFAKGGTSLWFSYKHFLKNYQLFDEIIFLITNIGRITLPDSTSFSISKDIIFIKIDHLLNLEKDKKVRDELSILKSYYLNIHDDEKEISHHNLIVENIKKIKNNTIIYPCFNGSVKDSKDLPLWDITKFEDKSSNFLLPNTLYTKLNMVDTRCCHLTEPNHKIVADMFLKKLKNVDYSISINDLIPCKNLQLYKKNI